MIEKILKSYLNPPDKFVWGFADMRGLLTSGYSGYSYGISIGLRLDTDILSKIKDGPTMEYYAHYRNVNTELANLTSGITADLRSINIDAIAIPPSVSTSELDTTYHSTLRTELSHKMVATRAGLGWIGKTDLLVTRKFGPRLRLVSILLKEDPGVYSKPVNKSLCGKCNICVEVCPAEAANGRKWDINTDRDEFFDPFKCRNQCALFGKTKLQADARVCGICVEACPVGR